MDMGKPRTTKNNNYPDGFYPPDDRNGCRMINPATGNLKALKTSDTAEGIKRYDAVMAHFAKEDRDHVVKNIGYLHTPILAIKSKEYRADYLNNAVSKRGASKGEKLDEDTIKSYTNHYKFLEHDEFGRYRIGVFNDPVHGVKLARQYLAQWLNKPRTYNYRLTTLSRLFNHLVATGDIIRNPCRDIEQQVITKRLVYVPHEHYIPIVREMAKEHEVYARACDWLYLMSGRNSNTLAIPETGIKDTEILFKAEKNRRYGSMRRDPELDFLIGWFREYKVSQNIISPNLIVHPSYLEPSETRNKKYKVRDKIAAKLITNEHLYRRFKKACSKVGLDKFNYQLRDIRPMSLTDEAVNRGKPSGKGLHGEAVERDYIRAELAENVTNTLKLIDWGK